MYTPSSLESVILVLQVYTTLYKCIHTYIMCIYTYICNYIYANKYESEEGIFAGNLVQWFQQLLKSINLSVLIYFIAWYLTSGTHFPWIDFPIVVDNWFIPIIALLNLTVVTLYLWEKSLWRNLWLKYEKFISLIIEDKISMVFIN